MGYGDPVCYGGTLQQTPNIDRLAREGVRFTDGYVTAAVCGPSRAGIITGAYQQKFGMQANPDGGRFVVPSAHKLMPEVMSMHGYKTGMFGKLDAVATTARFAAHIWRGAIHAVGKWNMPRSRGSATVS